MVTGGAKTFPLVLANIERQQRSELRERLCCRQYAPRLRPLRCQASTCLDQNDAFLEIPSRADSAMVVPPGKGTMPEKS